PTTALPGAAVTVTIANGPGNQTDWVTLAPASAADSGYLTWVYLNGLQTPPSVGATTATLTFNMPATPGAYNLRLFANNTLTKLATSGTVTVSGIVPAPALTGSPTTALPGTAVTVMIANGPGSQTDWIALVPAGAADSGYLTWVYLN